MNAESLTPTDRKTLEVVREILAYAHRELGDLKTPAPDLANAVGHALQISTVVLGYDGSGQEIALHRPRAWIE